MIKIRLFRETDKINSAFLAVYNYHSTTLLGKKREKFGPFIKKIGFFLKMSIFYSDLIKKADLCKKDKIFSAFQQCTTINQKFSSAKMIIPQSIFNSKRLTKNGNMSKV